MVGYKKKLGMLTDRQARNVPKGGKRLSVGGVPGLMFISSLWHQGCGRFELRYTSTVHGKRRTMGLGTYPDKSLAQVRRLAKDMHALNKSGIDPIDCRKNPLPNSFGDFAEIILSDDNKSASQGNLTESTVKARSRLIGQIQTGQEWFWSNSVVDMKPRHISTIIEPFWIEKPDKADKLRQLIDRIFRRAIAEDAITSNPMDCIGELLPHRPSYRDRVQHHPAMDYRNIPGFLKKFGSLARMTTQQRALVFAILTGARSSEATRMHWDEFRRSDSLWIIPKNRMKNRRPHIVPLSSRCIEIIKLQEAEYDGNDYVFPNSGGGAYRSLMGLLQGQNSTEKGKTATVHGFRSAFMDWGLEHDQDQLILDMCLSHDNRTRVEHAYQRSNLKLRRCKTLQDWADYCFSGF